MSGTFHLFNIVYNHHHRTTLNPFLNYTKMVMLMVHVNKSLDVNAVHHFSYRSGTVNSKSFVGKVLLRIKWKFELN